ncbi:putative wsc domain containing protein [Diaporthe ampelina]|uniref:Putative wsc domain containing protein n=1 Tax=Diaporthe ampelina TaxID=1214573 RepID=A0A0G2FDU5_9PEZI|nr:putative wsc domain containing protein [Diaporthe ampelina]
MRALEALFMPALVVHTSVAALYHPTPRAAYLEHILVDNWGAHASNFSSAMTPCSKYVIEVGRPALKSGRMTAAQWMRVAFHDFVTADVRGGFPDVVPESAVTPNNTDGGGGALVTTNNITTRSDLWLYEGDGNATVQALYDAEDGFLGTCVDPMGRMINTVSAGVDLGPPISPMEVKPINVTFDLDGGGGLQLSGRIRISTDTPLPIRASLTASDGSSEPVTLEAEGEQGSFAYGGTRCYSFSVGAHQDVTYTALEIRRGGSSGASSLPLQNSLIVVPGKTAAEGGSGRGEDPVLSGLTQAREGKAPRGRIRLFGLVVGQGN